ncbi:MAG: 4-hydroxy-tetrahydrodipicolinate synthase [SAR324 cluster bacterium]|uniref:4-hydroxy-tetrahydrodipicolinate synthase n=1 Tax=SAR324 cluster bacterium TaxID=2024889 RepID=A0A7X9FRK5_9DELT|nr:4-hydroxy-tetrahydrodipicolinate synthase [SAR324 cluster bacterium]
MTINKDTLRGTFPAIVTPFSKDGANVDFDSLHNLIEYQISARVDGLVVCGSTGEAQTLTDDEYQKVVSFTKEKVNGRVPVIAGIGTNSTQKGIAAAKLLDEIAVDGILLVAPMYNKPTQKGIIAHFEQIKRATRLPIIAYNVPGRTSVNILPATIATLVKQGTICGLKEASGSMDQVLDILSLVRDDCAVVSGEDSLVCALMLSGGKGVISASANIIPEIFVEITSAALNKEWERAKEAQYKALPWVRLMFAETNPIPVKTAVALKGIIKYPTLRLPLMPAEDATIEKIKALLG